MVDVAPESYPGPHLGGHAREGRGVVQRELVEKFGRDANPRGRDTGRGQTPEEMRAFRAPDVATLIAYYEKVRARTNVFLDELTDADLERPVQKPGASATGETVPMTVRLSDLIRDDVQHTGQIAYLRGLFRSHGWLDL